MLNSVLERLWCGLICGVSNIFFWLPMKSLKDLKRHHIGPSSDLIGDKKFQFNTVKSFEDLIGRGK